MNIGLYHHVWGIASALDQCESKMTGGEVADLINTAGFRTTYGTLYAGKRGTYRLFAAVWHWLYYDKDMPDEAEKVAYAFTDRNGRFPHE